MRAFVPLIAIAASASLASAEPAASAPPVAVEFVINGQEVAMGNDLIEPDDSPARYPGLLPNLATSFDASNFRASLPAGSVAGVTIYADRAEQRWPMRSLASFDGAAIFGGQRDYYKKIGTSLVSGIDAGLGELAPINAAEKYLVVIGDGNDTNPDAAKQQLHTLRKHAQQGGVRVISVIYKNLMSDPSNVVAAFDHETVTVANVDSILPAVSARIAEYQANAATDRLALSMAPVSPVTPPVAVEIVISGWEVAMGNDDVEEDEATRYPGYLHTLKHSLDGIGLERALPTGSVAGVITYADTPEIRWPLRNVDMLSSSVLGSQRDYYRKMGTGMVSAVDLAMAELAQSAAPKKFLVVIGDGNDTNNETAKNALRVIRTRAEQQNIEAIAIVYKNVLSSPEDVINVLDPTAVRVVAADSILPTMRERILASLATTPAPAPQVVVPAPAPTACHQAWWSAYRWQLAIGSLLALIAMGGVWFVRRERL